MPKDPLIGLVQCFGRGSFALCGAQDDTGYFVFAAAGFGVTSS